MIGRPMHRQVLLLASAQALVQTASVVVATIGGLAGGQVAPSPELATAPIAAMVLGTAVATVPASMWMARAGRRPGFIAGALLGAGGGLVGAGGLWLGSLALLCLGTFLVGAYQGFAQFYRFAAGEVSDEAFRPRAISLVFGGGVVAAVAGPLLARLGSPMIEPPYAGSFVLIGLVSVLGAGVLLGLRVPRTTAQSVEDSRVRPWRAIVGQPSYLVALFGAVTGFGVMILAMTATPIAMVDHYRYDLAAASSVIQLHVLGMYLPSFFTGSLITRFGVVPIMLGGVALLAGHVLMTLTGTGFGSFAGGLVMLGIGWNFLYIGGTTLLTTTYGSAEKGRAQATNDMTIFSVGLVCAIGAGALLQAVGWQALNLLLLPWLALCAAALLWLGGRQRRRAAGLAAAG